MNFVIWHMLLPYLVLLFIQVDYTNIALFPTLVPHTELFQLESKSIVIKASLTYKPIVPCPS